MTAAKKGAKITGWLPGLAFLCWVFLVALRYIDDFDYWTHLSLGRNYAATWQLFSSSPSLLLSERTISWPFQLMVYGLESLGSHPLVCLATALLAAFTFAPLAWRASTDPEPLKGLFLLLFLVWIVLVVRFRFVPRPELLAYLLFTLALCLLFSWIERPTKVKLFGLLALLLAWLPLHPTLYIGTPLLLAIVIILPGRGWWLRLWHSQLKRWGRRGRWMLLSLVLPLLALLLYGVGRFALRIYSYLTSGGVLIEITEMRPTWEFPDLLWKYLLALLLATILSSLVKEGRRRRLILLSLALLPGIIVVRNVPLSLIFMAFIAIEGVRGWSLPPRLKKAQYLLAALFVLTLLASGIYLVRMPYPAWGTGVHWEYFPRQAAEYVVQQHLPAPVFNNFDCGGYLNWRWQGAPPAFLDGRLGSKEIMSDHDQVLEGDGYERILKRYGIKTILLQPFYLNNGRLLPVVRMLLSDREWVLVDASDALIFVHTAELKGLTSLSTGAGWQLVLRQADRIGRLDSDMSHLQFSRGIALLSLGRLDEARSAFRQGFEQNPELTERYRSFKAL